MNFFSFSEIRLIISKSTSKNNISLPYLKAGGIKPKYFSHRISLIKTLKTYIKKYCQNSDKYNILYLSILYLDIILSRNKISLSHDKNLKYLCLCCFLLSLKFIGNYDTSKKVISNFCHNYKEEYRIFEIQCLMLLEHNLVYTTTYNYLNMILINEPKKLLSICNSLLYQICEDIIYTHYSPFYISIAIFQMAKISINENNHNHYDKYFHDERVKILIKKLNYLINPPTIKDHLIIGNNIINDNIKNNLNSTINNTNINIITNNNIQNNIVIINTICKKQSNNFNKESTSIIENAKTPIKIKELSKNKEKNITNDKNNKINNTENNIIEFKNGLNLNKINSDSKISNIISKSHFNLCRTKKNNIYNNHKTITIRQIKNKKQNYKINSFLNTSKNISNFINKRYEKNSFEIKRNLNYKNGYKEESFSTDIQTPNQFQNNCNGGKLRIISANKSSLNFQLVSGVSKEKLVKLSRNLSKSIIKDKGESPKKGKFNE